MTWLAWAYRQGASLSKSGVISAACWLMHSTTPSPLRRS